MQCPACKQDSASTTSCDRCGTRLANSGSPTSPGDQFSIKPEIPEESGAGRILLVATSFVGWLLVAFIGYARALRWSGGIRSAQSSGYFVGSVLTPILISALILWIVNFFRDNKLAGAKKNAVTASLAVFLSIMAMIGEAGRSKPLNEAELRGKMRHLAKQAAGKEASTGEGQWYDGPVREFYRELLETNQEYSDALAAQDQSELKTVYTPQSYATRKAMQKTIDQLKGVLEVDKKYESLDKVMKDFEKNIQASSASSFEKKEFIEGFHSTEDKSFAPRGETFRKEEEWLQSTINLYQFTLDHFASYKVQAKKLMFAKNDVREQFQSLQSKSLALHKTAMEVKKVFDASRQQALNQAGVKPEDLDPPAKK